MANILPKDKQAAIIGALPRVYAWMQDADGKRRNVTVLHMEKVTSPVLAVGSAIVQEFRERESEAEA